MNLFFWRKKRPILVADDAADIRRLFEEILRSQGYEVASAPSGAEAIKIAESRAPLLILLDIMMPVRDGLMILKDLKANPKTKDIPVVMVSVLQQAREVDRAFSLGAVGYIVKPFTSDRVVSKVQEVLSGGKPPSP